MLRQLLFSCASLLVIAASAPAMALSNLPEVVSSQDNPASPSSESSRAPASDDALVTDPIVQAALESFSIETTVLMTGEIRAALDAADGDPMEAIDDLNYILARYQAQADELIGGLNRSIEARLAQETDPERRVSISTTAAVLGEMIKGQPVATLLEAQAFDASMRDSSDPMPAEMVAVFDATKAFGADLNVLRTRVLAGENGDALAPTLVPRAEALTQLILNTRMGDEGLPFAATSVAERIRAAPASVAAQAAGPAPDSDTILNILVNAEGDRFLGLGLAVREEMQAAVRDSDDTQATERLEAVIARRQPEVDVIMQRLKALTDRWIASASNDAERAERVSARQSLDRIGDLEALADDVRQSSAGR